MTTVTAPAAPIYMELAARKPWHVRLRRVARQKPLGTIGALIIFAFIVAALFGTDLNIAGTTIVPGFSPEAPEKTNITERLQAPGTDHLLGTDALGRDVLSRVLAGARTAMIIGIAATGLALLGGTVIGIGSAYGAGWIDMVIQRIMDAFMALPPLILLLVLVTVLNPSMMTVILVLIFFTMPSSSRLIRGSTLVIKEQQYVEAARSIGATPLRVMTRHILPQLMAPILVLASVFIGATIVTEAALSFLGLGANSPENPTWGFMLFEAVARPPLATFYWMSMAPGIAITLTVLSFNLLGDALRDIFDPRLRGTGAGA
jgi:peptide/nickel transport system permease protein